MHHRARPTRNPWPETSDFQGFRKERPMQIHPLGLFPRAERGLFPRLSGCLPIVRRQGLQELFQERRTRERSGKQRFGLFRETAPGVPGIQSNLLESGNNGSVQTTGLRSDIGQEKRVESTSEKRIGIHSYPASSCPFNPMAGMPSFSSLSFVERGSSRGDSTLGLPSWETASSGSATWIAVCPQSNTSRI